MSWLARWWRQSDHYEQLSSHLRTRGMEVLTRTTITTIAASLALIAVATIWTPTGPRGPVQVACAVAAGAGAALGAVMWALRWPTRAQAIRFVVLSDVSIALAALSQSHPTAGLLTCTAFATMATYTAMFHPARLMAYNFLVTAAVGAFEVVRMAALYNPMAALCGYALLLTLNLAVPFGIQAVVHTLGTDAVRAERDQLTGLLNRRAFYRRARRYLWRDASAPAHLVVTVIDLDRFKQLNDRYGHSVGDDALMAVARALQENTDDTAVIGRVGGEEFVIADIWLPTEVQRRSQAICDAVAALPFLLTASVGTASVSCSGRDPADDDLLVELISAADAAMYTAKRGGGNRVCHHRPAPGRRDTTPLPRDAGYFGDELSA